MLNKEEIVIINKLLNGEEVDSIIANKVKKKVEYVVEMLEFQEEVQEGMARIQDKIISLNKEQENEENEETEE